MLIDLDQLLQRVTAPGGVSDIFLTVGRPPQVERDGVLAPCGDTPLEPAATAAVADQLLGDNSELRSRLEVEGAADVAFTCSNGMRLRANVFRVQGHHGVVLRVLPTEVPSLGDLNLPAILNDVRELRNGMVLVTGATGSGKSTTLSAIVDDVNRHRAVHVVTLEDPVEVQHGHRAATISQRELGRDFRGFADGLKAALRQAPKVILVGEMRDRETVEISLKAAETGHLVLSTLHTVDAGQTINRLAGMFDEAERALVRSRLAEVLRFVIAQRLLPKVGGGRVAALEVMGTDLAVRELVVNGESEERTFNGVIAGRRQSGWQTFDQHIVELLEAGAVTEEAALAYCTNRAELGRAIDRVKATRGESTSELGELKMAAPRRIAR